MNEDRYRVLTARAGTEAHQGSHEGTLTDEPTGRVVMRCGHRHRTERAAVQCVQRMRGGRGARRGN